MFFWSKRSQPEKRQRDPRFVLAKRAIIATTRSRFSATIIDISSSGMLVSAPSGAPAQGTVDLSFMLPGRRKMIHAKANVARTDYADGWPVWGLSFSRLSREDRAALLAYLDEAPRKGERPDKEFLDVGPEPGATDPNIPSPLPEE